MAISAAMMGGADGHDGHMFRINFLIWVFNLGILSFIFLAAGAWLADRRVCQAIKQNSGR